MPKSDADQLRGNNICIRYMYCTTSLYSKSESSSIKVFPVAVQSGLLETPKILVSWADPGIETNRTDSSASHV